MKQIEVVAAIIHDLPLPLQKDGRIFATQRGYGEWKDLTMHCYLCHVESGHLELKEHEAAKWLAPNELESVNWLPADWEVVKKLDWYHLADIIRYLKNVQCPLWQ